MAAKKDNKINEEERLALKNRARMVISQNPRQNNQISDNNSIDSNLNQELLNVDSGNGSSDENPDLVPVVTTLNADEVPNKAGAILRHAREKMGLSQRDIANKLLSVASTISDIENDRFNQATAAPFTVKKLRAYAEIVNLDPDTIENIYLENLNVDNTSIDGIKEGEHKSNKTHYYFYAAILIIVCITLTYAILPTESEQDAMLDTPVSEELSMHSDDDNAKEQINNESVQESITVNVEGSPSDNYLDENTKRAKEQALAMQSSMQSKANTQEPISKDAVSSVLLQNNKPKVEVQVGIAETKTETAPPETKDVKETQEQIEVDQEKTIALDKKLKDITSKVKLQGREGLASMNSVKITVKDDVALEITDSRKKILKSGVFKKDSVINVSGIPPIVISATDASLIKIHYMGGTISTPNEKQVKFTLPTK